ncbi:MAG: hypothetical protein IT574_04545 [Candidatus Aureabacteria bacterium]|nr:hypothetical protein [Candidatus Auribacterota bacterium]
MSRTPMFAVALCALAVAGAAAAGGWRQPVDMTCPDGWMSQVCFDGGTSYVSADDWRCPDGQPINVIRWWGEYEGYENGTPGPVSPPTGLRPNGFTLNQYLNDAFDPLDSKPGGGFNEASVPLADCNEAYAGTVYAGGVYHHIFSYQAMVYPWAQTAGEIYWLQVSAQFNDDPASSIGSGFQYGEWLNTPPADLLGTGHELNFMGSDPWSPLFYLVEACYEFDPINFAFEIGSLPVDLRPDKKSFRQTDIINVTANVTASSTPCYPFVRVIRPDGSALYYQRGAGFVPAVTPYLGLAAGPIALPEVFDYPVLQNLQFNGIPAGTYYLEGGAVDPATTTSVDDLKYLGLVDRKALVVE